MKFVRYSNEHENCWDTFVNNVGWNAMFLHSRKFLSYHDNRFKDESLLIYDEGNLIGIFPAARHPSGAAETVVSHPGATFGGLVAGAHCRGERCLIAMQGIAQHYANLGFNRLIYKVVPFIYHRIPFQDDLYALFRMGAVRIRCDISATIEATKRATVTKGRKYEINKARKKGVEIVTGNEILGEIYNLIEYNLEQVHKAKPVHSYVELSDLCRRFPRDIQLISAMLNGEVIAGLVMFNYGRVAHTQYIASNERGRESGGLDMLIEHSINNAFTSGFQYFDFGISNEKEGQYLNDGLYRYKRTFGAGSIVHEFYELDLGKF